MSNIVKVVSFTTNILATITFIRSFTMKEIIMFSKNNTFFTIFLTALLLNFVFTTLYIVSTQIKIKNLRSTLSIYEKNLKNEAKDFIEALINDPLSIDYNSPYFFLLLHEMGYSDGEINKIIKGFSQKKDKIILRKLDKIVKKLKK